MKLKCNLLHEEIAQLKSQLDTLHKPTIGNLIEKYKKLAEKLKDKEQHDTATIIDLVCVIYTLVTSYIRS